MVKLTKLFCVLVLCLFGIATANAKVEQVHATFENPSNTNTTWNAETRTFTWSTTYYNQLRNIGLPSGDITKYKKLVVDCDIKSGDQFRILIYKGGSNKTLYASNGVNEFILADTLKALYPDDYNEFLLNCDEICLSGNNNAAPGEAVINDVYLETYNDEGEKVYATFENPSNTNTSWDAETNTFKWTTTYYNQLRNIGLPSGDITKYKKLVVDTEIKSGDQFRILFYKGGSNKTLYASNGVNEFILADTLKALYPDDYNEFLLACDEICLSGNNNAAPGEAVINSVYLETYPENESVEIPDIVYEEDPGKPVGDFVDFTEVFPNLQPRLGLGEDGHPIVLGNGDVVVGQRSKNVIADLSPYTKLTLVTSPNLKLVLYMNHEIDAKQNAGDYTEEEAGKYLFQDLQADENGLIEYDLTQLDKQELNCICLPWDNSNKGTVWYILLTEKDGKTIYLNPAIWDVADITERYAAYMFNDYGLNAWADFTATAAARRAENGTAGAYTATIPARYTGIILCRMNGETTENNWENVWNQTEDIKNFEDNTSYTITGWGEGENAKSTYEENAVDVPEDIAIYPTGGDIAAALEEAKAKVAKVGDITINLAVDGDYTLGATLTAPNNIYVYGNEGTVTVTEEMTGDFITLNGTEVFAMKSETEASDHYLIPSVEIRGLNLKGLKGALVKDAQKTLVENLVIDYSNIEMPASNKNVLDFNGKGYAGKVAVTNSTIWAADKNTGFFAQYGSRPKNINGDWTQEFDFENNTIVNIANGKNFNNLKQNGTAQNVYTVKNNIFVNCGKQNQVVVGFNNGQTSSTPAWDVTGNYFAWGDACVNAAETEKAGQKDSEDIVKNCVEGTLAFTDAANGDFNGRFTLADDAETSEALGAPMWTITYSTPYYLAGNMNNWLNDGVEAEYNLAKNTAAAEGVEEYMITIDLAADAQFKVVKVGGEESIWYPVGSGNAFGENGELEKEGNYTIYFRPNADGGTDWFNGVIYVEYNGTTGINAVNTVAQDAVIYDMQGRRVVKAQKGLYIVNGKKTVVK